jgi:phospholipid/cholesterol/gamma-HCH transport system substrate-binding protein
MSGIEVGNVSSMHFESLDSLRQVKVVCRVKKAIWDYLTPDARVRLGTIGFLGDKYVEIVPGIKDGPPVEEMGIIPTEDYGSAPAMFKAGEEALEDAGSVVTRLDTMLSRMNRGEGTLGQLATDKELYGQMTRLLASLTKLSKDLQENQERLIGSLEKMSSSVADLSDQVDQNTGTIGRLFKDPALYDNLTATSARLDSVLTKIDHAEGNMGLLVNDTALYVELTNLLVRANNLITDIEKNPRKYFKFSVF